ncbi:MAG: acyltransferase family protein [Deltaproteobacteria bacterium]|nr:acyltransferase family protein [Deltaproteobacteria bacterium]
MNDSRLLDEMVGRAARKLESEGGVASLSKSFVDRFVSLTSELLDDDLNARVQRVFNETDAESLDPFGVEIDTVRWSLALIAYFYRFYFRAEVSGIEELPSGRMLLVANHSGLLPIDAFAISAALALDANPPRFARNTVDKLVAKMPFITMWYSRLGQILGTPENGRRLLERENALVSFPEGMAAVLKPFSTRYQLQPFGSGFMRLALQTNTPIVPVAVIGAEEQYISISDLAPLARLVGLPALPVVPQIFLGFPFPLPTKYRLYFGKPMTFSGNPNDDNEVIEAKVREVRSAIQSMLNRGLRERKAIFW